MGHRPRVAEFSLQLNDAELVGFYRIEFSRVALTDRSLKKPALAIGSVAIDYSLTGLCHRQLARIELENPRLLSTTGRSKNSSGRRPTSDKSWRVEQFSIRGGEGVVDLHAQPRIRFEFSGDLTAAPAVR